MKTHTDTIPLVTEAGALTNWSLWHPGKESMVGHSPHWSSQPLMQGAAQGRAVNPGTRCHAPPDPASPESPHGASCIVPIEKETEGLAQHEGLPKAPWSRWEPQGPCIPTPLSPSRRLRASREDKRAGDSRGQGQGRVRRRAGKELPHLSLEGGLVLGWTPPLPGAF